MMTKRLSFFFVFSFLTLSANATAQTPTIEVTTDHEAAEFSARGKTQSVRVEVYAPSGELVFEGDQADGQSVRWPMLNQQGERVADGVYLATITVVDPAGKRRKRIEQVTVSSPQPAAAAAYAPPPQEALAPTGAGTAGRIPKWTTSTNLANSVITESVSKIGVNITPTATFQVNQSQPAPLFTNGVNATTLLQTSGGKGGDTTGAGRLGGRGASISLVSGNGGNAASGSTNGSGGNITLQPGSAGTGGAGGAAGNVLLAPSVGNVGVGTMTPASKLTIAGGDIQLTTAGRGIKFPDNTVQKTAATSGLASVTHNSTLSGAGTSASPLTVASLGVGTAQLANSSVTAQKVASGQVVKSVNGLKDNVTLAAGANVTVTPSGNTLTIASTNTGISAVSHDATLAGAGTPASPLAVAAPLMLSGSGTQSDPAVIAAENSGGGYAVRGVSDGGIGVRGDGDTGVWGDSTVGYAVYGQSTDGFAGYFQGKARVTGNFDVFGDQSFGVTGRQMINLIGTQYGIGVQSNVHYFRTGGGYNWYKGGVHNHVQDDPGAGGVSLMRLDSSGNLYTTGAINPPSDRNVKANFKTINTRSILDKLASITVQSWNYRGESEAVRHIGPVAQDFRAAFGLGSDERHIATVDADGVALASVQALYQMMLEKDKEIEQQIRLNKQQNRQIEHLQAQLNQMKRTIQRRRAAKR